MLLALCFKENITILTKPYDRKRDQAPFWTMQGLKDDERLEKRLPDRSVTLKADWNLKKKAYEERKQEPLDLKRMQNIGERIKFTQ